MCKIGQWPVVLLLLHPVFVGPFVCRPSIKMNFSFVGKLHTHWGRIVALVVQQLWTNRTNRAERTSNQTKRKSEQTNIKVNTHTHGPTPNANTKCLSAHFSTDELYKINVHLKIKVSKTAREKKNLKRKKFIYIYIVIVVVIQCGARDGHFGVVVKRNDNGGDGKKKNIAQNVQIMRENPPEAQTYTH